MLPGTRRGALGRFYCMGPTRRRGGTAIAGSFLQSWMKFGPFSSTEFLPEARVGWPEHADPSPFGEEEPWEQQQQIPIPLTPARNGRLWWEAVSPQGILPQGCCLQVLSIMAGIPARSGIGMGMEPPSPASAALPGGSHCSL